MKAGVPQVTWQCAKHNCVARRRSHKQHACMARGIMRAPRPMPVLPFLHAAHMQCYVTQRADGSTTGRRRRARSPRARTFGRRAGWGPRWIRSEQLARSVSSHCALARTRSTKGRPSAGRSARTRLRAGASAAGRNEFDATISHASSSASQLRSLCFRLCCCAFAVCSLTVRACNVRACERGQQSVCT